MLTAEKIRAQVVQAMKNKRMANGYGHFSVAEMWAAQVDALLELLAKVEGKQS